jgi:hypothetical protein
MMLMLDERWKYLMSDKAWDANIPLTKEEVDQGWHFCDEFDGLLRQPRDADNPTGFECGCLKGRK